MSERERLAKRCESRAALLREQPRSAPQVDVEAVVDRLAVEVVEALTDRTPADADYSMYVDEARAILTRALSEPQK